MEGTGAGLKLRCAAAFLPIVLLLAFATLASAAGLRPSAAGSWGRLPVTHSARAMRVRSSARSRISAGRKASPALGATGTIKGEITDAVTSTGIGPIDVCAWPLEAEEDEEEFFEPECEPSGSNGNYEITGLAAGEYVVEFATPFNSTLNYVLQYYKDASSFEAATPVTVNGATVNNVNAAMVHGGRIAGKVTAAAGGAALAGIEVCAGNTAPEVESFGCGETDASGEYLVTGLADGSYKVGFQSTRSAGYISQFYSGKSTYGSADEVTVSKEATTEGIDAAMVQGGRISGVVTVAGTGKPLSEAFVCALNFSEEVFACAESETDGAYTITGLPEGNYDVEFFAGTGFEAEFFDEAFSLEEATAVHAAPGSARTGINAAMWVPPRLEEKRFPTITGTIAVGSTLSCSQGSWLGTAPMTFSYQWLRDKVAIPGATATTYTIQSADIGHFVACMVTATNRANSSWATSIGYRVPVPLPAPAAAPATTATTQPAGGVQSLRVVAPSIAVLGRLHVAGGGAVAKLHCALGPCKGTLQLTVTVTRRHRSGGHTVTRHATITIGSGSFSLAQGASGKVTIHLTAQGRKLLAHAARHPQAAKLKLAMQNAPLSSKAVVVG